MDAISLPADILHLAARLALATLLGAAIDQALHRNRHADPDDG